MSDKKDVDTIDEKDRATWDKIVASNIDSQADYFLKAFTLEYAGNFEEVLEKAEMFKKKSKNNVDLDEQQAHYLFEKQNNALTIKELRDNLSLMDIDKNNRLCFVEYCLYLDKKTVGKFFLRFSSSSSRIWFRSAPKSDRRLSWGLEEKTRQARQDG